MEKRVLIDVGLSEGESDVLLALLSLGQSSVMQLSKETGRHRTHIYDTLEKLMEKGLVSYSKTENKRIFHASNPENLLN